MADRAHIDFETASAVNLKTAGVHRYVEHPTTRIWLFSYRLDNGIVRRWHPGDPAPWDLLEHIAMGKPQLAHNAAFERVVWNQLLTVKYEPTWPKIQIWQQRCTMARGNYMSYPGKLDQIQSVIGTKFQKDKEGEALMRKMMRPKVYDERTGYVEWHDSPENISRLGDYCDVDVYSESELDDILWPLPPEEQETWEIDQEINDRGILIDVPAVSRAVELVELAKRRNVARMKKLTGGITPSQVGKLVDWINARGIPCYTLRKADQEEIMLAADAIGDPVVREVIELRAASAKTSTAKYTKMLDCVCDDGRLRGQFDYSGARRTHRWAGRLVQPQNFVRMDFDEDGPYVMWAGQVLVAPYTIDATYQMLEYGLGTPLAWLSKSLRYMIRADYGARFIGGDYSNIEGRTNAWLANETWKLDAFRAFDNKTGPDLYTVTAGQILGKEPTAVVKAERQSHGKIPELACGFQGGVNAFVTMVITYRISLEDIYKVVRANTPDHEWNTVYEMYKWASDQSDLPQHQWTAIKIIVKGWRARHPAIVSHWWELQDAAISAILTPGVEFPVYHGRVAYMFHQGALLCRLPSGHCITYLGAHVARHVQEQIHIDGHWVDTNEFLPFELEEYKAAGYQIKKRERKQARFYGLDGKTKNWQLQYLYGGTQCENIVQATARDLLRDAMRRVRRAKYPLVLHAHDELLAECEYGFGSKEEFKALMAEKPRWPVDLSQFPISVAAWEDERYVK